MRFSEVIGQSMLVGNLQKMLASGRIAHSYLFAGAKGIGKKTIGGIFAQGILCRAEKARPCGNCVCCRQFENGNHPDVIKLIPDKTRIGVDSIRSIQNELKTKPYQAGKKLVLIECAHALTFQAQNALLKALEEPPEHVVFILFADRLQLILPTVQSRCRIFKLQRLSKQEVLKILIRRTDISPEKAMACAALSEGNPGKAITRLTSDEFNGQRQFMMKFLDELSGGTPLSLLEQENLFENNREGIDQMLELLLLWFRDVLVFKQTNNKNIVINSDMIELMERQTASLSIGDALYILETLIQARRKIEGNANQKLVTENMLLNISGRFRYAGDYRGEI